MTYDQELEKIAADRELWAKEARDKDLAGSATELELTARLARELIHTRRVLGIGDR